MNIIRLDAKTIYNNAIVTIKDLVNDGCMTWSMASNYLDSLHSLANGDNDGGITRFCKDGSIAWIYPTITELEGEIILIFEVGQKVVATVGDENISF